jgi:hypothetical protein
VKRSTSSARVSVCNDGFDGGSEEVDWVDISILRSTALRAASAAARRLPDVTVRNLSLHCMEYVHSLRIMVERVQYYA